MVVCFLSTVWKVAHLLRKGEEKGWKNEKSYLTAGAPLLLALFLYFGEVSHSLPHCLSSLPPKNITVKNNIWIFLSCCLCLTSKGKCPTLIPLFSLSVPFSFHIFLFPPLFLSFPSPKLCFSSSLLGVPPFCTSCDSVHFKSYQARNKEGGRERYGGKFSLHFHPSLFRPKMKMVERENKKGEKGKKERKLRETFYRIHAFILVLLFAPFQRQGWTVLFL